LDANYRKYQNELGDDEVIPVIKDNNNNQAADNKNNNNNINKNKIFEINNQPENTYLVRNNYILENDKKDGSEEVVENNENNEITNKNSKVVVDDYTSKDNNSINAGLSIKKNKTSRKIFDDYICSYEFLFDMFSQLEFMKMLMLDEALLLSFAEISKIYISIDSKDSNNAFNEIKRKMLLRRDNNGNEAAAANDSKQESKGYFIESILRQKIEKFIGSLD